MLSVLVVGPHPDDQELGMGGTIAKLCAQGHKVTLLDMTDGEPTPYGDPVTRAGEASKAAAALSSEGNRIQRVMLGLPNREVEHTIEARHAVAGVIRAVGADVIFVPYFEDAHPDHRAVTRIVEDARFDAKLTKVEMPRPRVYRAWNEMFEDGDKEGHGRDAHATRLGETRGEYVELEVGEPRYAKWLFYYYATHLRWVADPSFVIDTTGFETQKKESILAYRTQFVLPEKNRRVVEWLEHSGAYFGSRIGAKSGEPFFTKEPVGLDGLGGLVM